MWSYTNEITGTKKAPEDQEQGNKDHSAVRQGDSELSEGESDGDEEVGSVNDPLSDIIQEGDAILPTGNKAAS